MGNTSSALKMEICLALDRADAGMQPSSPDGEALMDRLLEKGVEEFRFTLAEGLSVILPVEDDVIFLVDACRELQGRGEALGDEHSVFLGDGVLSITGRAAGHLVAMEVEHCPHLDRRFLKRFVEHVSFKQYAAAWSGVLDQLISAAGPPPVKDAGTVQLQSEAKANL